MSCEELKSGALLKIGHENSDRIASGLQCCICRGKKGCRVESNRSIQDRVTDFELSRMESEDWAGSAQTSQQYSIFNQL